MTSADYEKISQTALLTAYPRIFTDIPFSREIFYKLEEVREEEVPAELKVRNLAPELEARYKLVDKLLKQNDATQVLEIASGFSPRGMEWSKDNSIEYVEVELPGLMKEKEDVTKKIIEIPKNLHFEKGSALNLNDIKRAAKHFKKERKIAVVHEGLLRYLNLEEKTMVGENIHYLLGVFDGMWITPDVTLRKLLEDQEKTTMPGKNAEVAELTGRKINLNCFKGEGQAKKFFEGLGFSVEKHNLLEVEHELVSPHMLNLSFKEVKRMIGSGVVFIMRLR